EAALQFSLNFDTTILSSPVVAVGSGAPPGSALTINPNQLAMGRIGILLDSGNTFIQSPPARQVVTVTFNVAPGTIPGTITPVTFGDLPLPRSISDAFGIPIPASYVDGAVTVATAAPGFESDVSPRPNGDGMVLAPDVTQMRRFATALDTPNPGTTEGQRADSAPRATFGDGSINGADVIQARRYATGLDPLTPVGGPLVGTSIIPDALTSIFEDVYAYFFGREIRVTPEKPGDDGRVTVAVEITPYGDEIAAGFTLEYDQAKVSNPQISLAEGAPAGAVLTANTNEAGKIAILVDSTEAFIASAVPKRFVTVTFDVAPGARGATAIALTNSLANKATADANGNTLTVRYLDASVDLTGNGRVRKN
ncbi:MAG: cohesin domain-containing protein, partial [Pyrinomonadaceae bacterium]